MFKKNIKPILMAGALALATAVSPVLAEGNTPPNVNNGGTITVTKNFEYAYGVNFDNNVTVTINVAKAQFNSLSVPTNETGFPDLTFVNGKNTMTFNSNQNIGEDATTSGTVILTKNVQLSLPTTYLHAGEYDYRITETVTDASGKNTPKSGIVTEYQLRVYVKNGENGPVIYYVTAAKVAGTNETPTSVKVEDILFENQYNETDTADLTITKNTVGDYADLTKAFSFNITLKKPTVSANDTTKVKGVISKNNTKLREVEVTYGTSKDFTLVDGEKLVFTGLQAGTSYTITEVGAEDGYTPSLALTGDDNASVKYTNEGSNIGTGADVPDGASAVGTGTVMDGATNTATFTNTHTYDDEKNNPITGVIVNNMPYIALLGASGAGLVVLAASKKRSKK